MGRRPSIPHRDIVEFILAGHTTQDAKDRYGFKTDNIANLRVYAAFKALGVTRPRYNEPRICEFCGEEYVARDRNQRTCGAKKCQTALIVEWHRSNPETPRESLRRYRATEKGRQNNLRMHRRRRERGLAGSAPDRWNFAATEIKKSLRKLSYLAFRNPWEYRLQHVQKVAQLERGFTPRNRRNFESDALPQMWNKALRAVQTSGLSTLSLLVSSC